MSAGHRRSLKILPNSRGFLSLGGWLIVALALLSMTLVICRTETRRQGLELWTYARTHVLNYEPIIAHWNEVEETGESVQLFLIGPRPLERRVLSGFFSGTPVADLIEIERSMAGRLFSGPLEAVGFVDLTERLRAEGIDTAINEPSFGPWTSRGRIFGLPHDVHPVLLGYRADLVEQSGIDMTTIETWDDFARILSPLVQDFDGDGRPDRYLLNMWHTNKDLMEVLLLQAGGGFFDESGTPVIDSPANARVLATIVTWGCGPKRIAIDAPEFTASGNQLRLGGAVVCSLVPDWLCGVWQHDLPELGGKIKLIPLPAWEPGGRRTSVWGGTMLGISRTTRNPEVAWKLAKHLYLSPELAESVYRTVGIISPVKKLWTHAFYDEPSPYFCAQSPGRLYIDAAPAVPRRTSSPFNELAKDHVQTVAVALREYALAEDVYTRDELLDQAHRLLREAEDHVRHQMERNIFHREEGR
ncbi:MAG: extracellular solute-binding protein [bacterium]|nr:extracellular solute-binding protein [bacterium]